MKKGTAMKLLRIVRNVVLLVLALCLCAVLALAFLGWQMYTQALEEMPLDQKVRQVRAQESYTTFEELPDTYVQAVIAAEDHRFYQHSGIDVIAIGRALWNDLKAMSFVEGGQHHHPAAGEKPVLYPGKRADPQGGGDVHGVPPGGKLHQRGDL